LSKRRHTIFLNCLTTGYPTQYLMPAVFQAKSDCRWLYASRFKFWSFQWERPPETRRQSRKRSGPGRRGQDGQGPVRFAAGSVRGHAPELAAGSKPDRRDHGKFGRYRSSLTSGFNNGGVNCKLYLTQPFIKFLWNKPTCVICEIRKSVKCGFDCIFYVLDSLLMKLFLKAPNWPTANQTISKTVLRIKIFTRSD